MFKEKKIIDKISNYFLFTFLFFLKLLGKNKSRILCSSLLCHLGPYTKFNEIAKINLNLVWPNISHTKTKDILKKMWCNIGINLGEFVFLKNYNPYKCKNTKILGISKIKNILKKNKQSKKGIIFFSAHFSNWEIGPIVLKKLGLDTLCIYRKSNNIFMDNTIQNIRKNFATYTPKGDTGAKKSFLWLRKGKCLALLVDQKLNEGKNIDFLGIPSKTATAIAELAIRMDLELVPLKILRNKNNSYEITFCKSIKPNKENLSHEKKVINLLKEINNIISKWIKNNPEQWLWIHRRWEKKLYIKK